MSFKPTEEQQGIIDCEYGPTDIIKASAFSGTGKTATLLKFAEAHPNEDILYVAFSKPVQLEAETKFKEAGCSNVTCKTSHSLAWPDFGKKYKDKLVPSLKIKVIAEALGFKKWDVAKYTLQTVMNFLASPDSKITKGHVPPEGRLVAARAKAEVSGKEFDPSRFDQHTETTEDSNFVDLANKLWKRMCDTRDEKVGMVHDGYLKLWQLSKPDLSSYGVILLDEAQDINPATADVVLRQNCVRILVGDVHQQIYSFRGADNILARIKEDHSFYLTQSFRFGRKIGDLASLILKNFKGERREVVGLNGEGEIRNVDLNKPYTYISRTNAFLFAEAVKLYQTKKLGFIGGVKGYKFDDILDTYYLYSDKKASIKDAYIRSFSSFDEMSKFAEEVDDVELKVRIFIVKTYKDRIPQLIEDITRRAVDPKLAQVILCTGHKSKGLEFEQVMMGDDFPSLVIENKEEGSKRLATNLDMKNDEFNLTYVAATRAISVLSPSRSLVDFLKFIGREDLLDK